MERKIYINDTASNRTITLTTDATTFGQVKEAALAAGINIDGKDWLEGITRTSPRSDDSILPSNVEYKGNVTNDLVFILTNTNKNIQSGMMSRIDLYNAIKINGWQEEVKAEFGKPYTNVSTVELDEFVSDHSSVQVEDVQETCSECNKKYNVLIQALAQFILDIDKHNVYGDIIDLIEKRTPKSLDLSAEDIEAMFR